MRSADDIAKALLAASNHEDTILQVLHVGCGRAATPAGLLGCKGGPMIWPPPDASRHEVAAFLARHGENEAARNGQDHEAPLATNGPNALCAACGIWRVPLGKPFCDNCMIQLGIEKARGGDAR